MTQSAERQGDLVAYQRALTGEAKYATPRQIALKERVFSTFDRWLRFCGAPGLEQGRALVDLGSADGSFVEVCRRHGLDAVGFDAADGLDFERDALPRADASADIVTAISVIEHLHSPGRMLREARRVLKAGGAIVLVCPNWRYSWREYFDDPTHVHPYTEKSLPRALAMHGFSDVRVAPWLVNKPDRLWAGKRAFFFAYRMIPFRGDAPAWIPGFLKGRSASLLAFGRKNETP